jgi:DNA-binding beta-propeller fold protein YncE
VRRRTKRKVVLLLLLLLLLACLGAWFANFLATKSLVLDLRAPDANAVTPPVYLYSFAGEEPNSLQEPIGVLADGGEVFVADGKSGRIMVFREDGTFLRAFGNGTLQIPLYIAKNPKDGNLYISDRRKHAVFIFKRSGEFVRVFDPALPKEQLPKFDTKGDQWVPVALDFAPDGSMYVLEYLNGHRLVMFDPDGKFVGSVGGTGVSKTPTDLPGRFQFPNSIKVHKGEVFVADSNNRRVQVLDMAGVFKRFIPASGLPRGVAFLPRPSNATSETTEKFVVVDTLSHDGSIFGADGARILNFGERGVADGQFNYPADVSIGGNSIIFITDTLNLRVQAWGWPESVSPVPRVLPREPVWYLALLPFLLLPLLRRKKRFYATADFIEAMLEGGLVHTMPHRRRRWLVSQATHDAFRDASEDDIRLSELLEVTEHSDSDARALEVRLEIDRESAATLAAAQRAKVFCTEDAELRRAARLLDMDVVNHTEYVERFGGKAKAKSSDQS